MLVLPPFALHGAQNNLQPVAGKPQNQSAGFIIQPGPPPGFEDAELNVNETNYISIYYGNTFLGNVMGTYNNSNITLTNIGNLITKIPGIINPELVAKALQGSIPTNSDHLCSGAPSAGQAYCSVITPDVAGVIFDPNTYRATIFVNPKYLNATEQGQFRPNIPDSSAGFSYIANNSLSIATSPGSQTYSLNNLSIFGNGNNTFNVNSNITENNINGISTTSYSLQNAYLTRLKNGNYYEAGVITPDSNGGFLGAPTILGASVQNYGILPETAQGSPLIVYLPLPSTVAVYRSGYLISTQSFNAGKQSIDTSTFPTGSYMVTLKITNNVNQVDIETQFFVKQSSLPPSGSPNYELAAGFLQSNSVVNSGSTQNFIFPTFSNVPILSYNELRKIGIDYGLQSSFLTSFNRAYLSETLNYYGIDWQIAPGVLVSNNQQYGWLLNFSYIPVSMPNFQFSSNNQKILNSQTSNIAAPQDVTMANFSPVNQTSLQSINSFNWTINDKTQVSFSQTYNKQPGAGGQMQYGLDFTRTLYSNELLNLSLGTTFTKTAGQDSALTMTINSSFNTIYDINVGLNAGYGNNNPVSNTDGSTYNVYKPNYSETISKSVTWGPNSQNNLTASANLSQNFTYNNNMVNLSYNSNLMSGSLSYSRSVSKQYVNVNGGLQSSSQTTSQLSGNIYNNIAITSGGVGFGYQGGSNAGVMTNISAPKPVKAEVYINGQDYGAVSSNDSKAFFVPPYETYDVTIQPQSAAEYGFDSRPKVVTVYSGNVADVKWTLTKQYVLFAKIVDESGKPLDNMLMLSDNPSDFNTTDQNGYIQANMPEDATSISFKGISGTTCTVKINPAEIKKQDQNDLVVLDKPLVCSNS